MFTENEGSTFHYWFAHWCAFQMTALNLKAWKVKYLLHDIEKPWLRLMFHGDPDKVQACHITHNKHHAQYAGGVHKLDYEAMVIDWECARLTKKFAPRTAYQMIEIEVGGVAKSGASPEDVAYFEKNVKDAIMKIGLWPTA